MKLLRSNPTDNLNHFIDSIWMMKNKFTGKTGKNPDLILMSPSLLDLVEKCKYNSNLFSFKGGYENIKAFGIDVKFSPYMDEDTFEMYYKCS